MIQNDDGTGNTHFTVDNLTVRKSMNVYELVVNKIRATNGALWVSDYITVIDPHLIVSTTDFYIYTEENDYSSMVVGDKVRCQVWDGANSQVKLLEGNVTEIGPSGSYPLRQLTRVLLTTGSTADIDLGDIFVRVDSSVSGRDGALYLTSSDNGSPYMDVTKGGNTAMRVGNLSGVSTNSGYGIWGSTDGSTENLVISTDGYARIAGWNFDNKKLYKDTNTSRVVLGEFANVNANGIMIQPTSDVGTTNNSIRMFGYTTAGVDYSALDGFAGTSQIFRLDTRDGASQISGWKFDNLRLSKTLNAVNIDLGIYRYNTTFSGLNLGTDSTNRISILSDGTNYFLSQVSGGITSFKLGTTGNKIAGWEFEGDYLWAGNKFGAGAGLEMKGGSTPRLVASKDNNSYVTHFYDSSTN